MAMQRVSIFAFQNIVSGTLLNVSIMIKFCWEMCASPVWEKKSLLPIPGIDPGLLSEIQISYPLDNMGCAVVIK